MQPKSLFLACILILLLSSTFVVDYSKATSSQCRSPSSSSTTGKTRTLSAQVEEILESELLSAHMTLSVEGLNEDDLEFFHEVTDEQINTLRFGRRFRRAFRRIRRVVRRVGRIVRRVVRAAVRFVRKLTRLFRRRKASHIVANSISKFNGYTGPTSSKLDSRREFEGTSASTAAGAAQTLKSARRIARLIKRNKKTRRSVLKKLKKFGKRLGKRLSNRLVSSMNKLLRKTKKSTKTTTSSSKCVACRVDCMKEYNGIGALYDGCTTRYYYYGCQLVAPCLKTSTADADEIEGMVGICAYRNGCKFKAAWRRVGVDERVTNNLVSKVRAGGQDPE